MAEESGNKTDRERIQEAVRSAETRTSAEIRVVIHHGDPKEDPVAAAHDEFVRLGMEKTRAKNGVLIYLVEEEFIVVGDSEVLRRYGDQRWQRIIDEMGQCFEQQDFTIAIVEAIGSLAAALSKEFPRKWRNPNELSDEVIES